MGKPPSTVKVGAKHYAVTEDAIAVESLDADGITRAKFERIDLKPSLSPGTKRLVLLHETLHALVDDAGLDFANKPDDDKIEEWLVSALAPRLLALLRENPRLLAFLLDNGRVND